MTKLAKISLIVSVVGLSVLGGALLIPKDNDWNYKNFESYEFDSPDLPGSGINMQDSFMRRLETARIKANIRFIIKSGIRTQIYNDSLKNSVKNSAHIKGLAVDISCVNDNDFIIIIKALAEAGFKRIGIGKNFIHVDYDLAKPYPVVWAYPKTPKSRKHIGALILKYIKNN